jgi:hypothetical protein
MRDGLHVAPIVGILTPFGQYWRGACGAQVRAS